MHQRPLLRLAPLTLVPALAAAAVVGLGATPAQAGTPAHVTVAADVAETACGRPARPPVFDSIEHPAVVTVVPAVTHPEWRWERSIATTEVEHGQAAAAASGTWLWERTVDLLELQWARTVVDREYVRAVPEQGHHETRVVTPAVVVTLAEFVHQKSGETRWERAGWNADDNGKGWSPTGATRQDEVTPAVTEQVWVVDVAAVPEVSELTHQETGWIAEGGTVPADAVLTGSSRVAGTTTESVELLDGESPVGAGWTRGAWTGIAAAEVETTWLPEGAPAPDGFTPTGSTRPGAPDLEQSAGTTPTAPAGDGWRVVPGSEVTVVDVPAHELELEPAWVEDFVVTPAVPATAPCPAAGGPSAEAPETEVAGYVEDAGTAGAGDQAAPPEVAAGAEALPATGSAVDPWLLGLGVAGVLAGTCLVRRASR